eukprot:Skav213260  [mRNA]  locus=scaffold1311:357032:357661:+ [translate_table: standard]
MLRCLLLAASGGMAMRQLEDGKTEARADAMDLEEASIDWSSIPTPRASETLEFEGFEPSAVLEETEVGCAWLRMAARLVEGLDVMSTTKSIFKGKHVF